VMSTAPIHAQAQKRPNIQVASRPIESYGQ
jgi:hypothetical protein